MLKVYIHKGGACPWHVNWECNAVFINCARFFGHYCFKDCFKKKKNLDIQIPPDPRHPVIFSADDWGVQSPPQHSIWVPLAFSEGDWIPRAYDLENPDQLFLKTWVIKTFAKKTQMVSQFNP